MELSELLETSPETLAEKQRNQLTYHAIQVLNRITEALSKGDYKTILKNTFNSPAGDGYGTDSTVINFCYKKDQCLDIGEVVEALESLTKVISNKKK